MRLRDRGIDLALRAAWHLGPRVPERAGRLLENRLAHPAIWLGVADTRTWAANAAVLLGRPCTRAEQVAAVASYARYWREMLALPAWDGATLESHVRLPRLAEVQADLAETGCVVALAHAANWDLAGAYACAHDMPVTSVAEQLPGAAFGLFLRHREGLGMRIHGHRDRGLIEALVADARERRLVCLLADRDLRGRGVPVVWATASGPRHLTMPVGPALVAQRAETRLRALTTHYDGDHMVCDLSDPIDVGPGREGIAAAMQAIADHMAPRLAAHVVDWHVFQPFFDRGVAQP